jgi:hypothetical protein
VFAQLPDGASFQRNDEVQRQIGEIARHIPGVELTFAIEGLSILDSTTKSNALTVFFPLKPFSERIGHPEQSAAAIVTKLHFHSWRLADGHRERRGSRNGPGFGHRRLCWNDQGDNFRDLSYPSLLLCDHEDFCPGTKDEAKRRRASNTERKRRFQVTPVSTSDQAARRSIWS